MAGETPPAKAVPKHPWEEPPRQMPPPPPLQQQQPGARHHLLAHKSSLPPELGALSVVAPPTAAPTSSSSSPTQHHHQLLAGHPPISRTVSDSYGQQHQRRQQQQQQQLRQQQHPFHHRGSKEAFAASRRKLESEDSSYDSDHDNSQLQDGQQMLQQQHFHLVQHHQSYQQLSAQQPFYQPRGGLKLPFVQISKSHDDVSRTPSETLAAEFEEYVTVKKSVSPAAAALAAGRSRENSPVNAQQQQPFETAEHIDLESVVCDPSYTGKVEFALRLGYSEAQLQRALLKLGHGAGQNQLLEELIRLQKSCRPPAGASPDPDASGSDVFAAANADGGGIQAATPAQASNRGAGSRAPAAAKLSNSGGAKEEEASSDALLPVVIDGSNVAMSHGNKDVFSCAGIRLCVRWFQNRGHRDITVFVPKWRKEASKPDTPISDQFVLTELEKERLLSFTPSRQVRGKRYVCHDDRYILNLAAETGAVVVSNDNYRDLINEKPEFKRVIEEKILMYSFVNDRFMPPDDPLGRNGPTLDQFLRKRRVGFSAGGGGSTGAGLDQQPCPYGKKCTYGNKCKFFHPERGNQPQKSVTEKLKEQSSQMISEVRARGQSRDSSPGNVVAVGADQLMRTMSAQPLSSASSRGGGGAGAAALQEKQALCRTKSTFPRISGGGVEPAVGPHLLPPHPPPPPPPGAHQFWQQAPAAAQFGIPPPPPPAAMAVIPDTSLPPPPPRSPWSGAPIVPTTAAEMATPVVSEANNNSHRKLARQLTLNPTYDPRIHQHRGSIPATMPPLPPQHQFPFPPPPGMPPPTFAQQQHAAVTRNSSAPEQSGSLYPMAAFAAKLDLQHGPPRAVPVTSEALEPPSTTTSIGVIGAPPHGHLQRMSSTSDSQLHRGAAGDAFPDAAVDADLKDPSAVSPIVASAISPLIGASAGGVWEAERGSGAASADGRKNRSSSGGDASSSSSAGGARSKLYYHLAAVFPEEQVLAAMRALPEETDAQKICSYIIRLGQQQQQQQQQQL